MIRQGAISIFSIQNWGQKRPTLPETNQKPLKIGRNPIGKDRIPTIHFQGQAVSFRECNYPSCMDAPDVCFNHRDLEDRVRKQIGDYTTLFDGVYMSNEKRAPGCLGYLRDEILPSYIGVIINQYEDPY